MAVKYKPHGLSLSDEAWNKLKQIMKEENRWSLSNTVENLILKHPQNKRKKGRK